ncbi:MAG TPA: XRE family transcriptional regulator [Vicinamibacterales bacterium]|nr:XRE family transcriptional regulator [Vicinamibacterales bacterium]
MARKFAELRAQLSPEARARVDARVQQALAEMPLKEVRRAHALAQNEIGEMLGMAQPEVSKLEQRSDCLISTVRRYIEALGGELDIVARFPNGTVRINQFAELGRIPPKTRPAAEATSGASTARRARRR